MTGNRLGAVSVKVVLGIASILCACGPPNKAMPPDGAMPPEGVVIPESLCVRLPEPLPLPTCSGSVSSCRDDLLQCSTEQAYCFLTQRMLTSWHAIYSTYNDTGDRDLVCTGHKACAERTALGAYVAALYGDYSLFNAFLDVWVHFHMRDGHFAQWLLDPDGNPIVAPCQNHPDASNPKADCFRISSGDDVRMLEALAVASCRFADKSPSSYGSYRAVAEAISGPLADTGPSSDRGIFKHTGFQGEDGTLQVQQCEWPVLTPMVPTCFSPNHAASLNVTNGLTLRLVYDWLAYPVYGSTATFTAEIQHQSQEITTAKVMFWPQFILAPPGFCDEAEEMVKAQKCFPELGTCQLIACLDIAARLAAFRNLTPSGPIESDRYFEFLSGRYNLDGALFHEYVIDNGDYFSDSAGVSASAHIPEYVLFAKLAIELKEWEWASRAIRDHVVFNQVREDNDHPSALDPYLGAIMPRSAASDANSFDLLEALVALQQMRTAGLSLSRKWRTVARCTATTGGIHDIAFKTGCAAKSIKVLGQKRGAFDFSIYEIQAFDRNGMISPLPPGYRVFASSIQRDSIGYFPARLAFDGRSDNVSRWASEHHERPMVGVPDARPEEWIYAEFDTSIDVKHLQINWENAFAAVYNLQLEIDPSSDCTLDVGSTTGATCAAP